jgi:hypothetical protein
MASEGSSVARSPLSIIIISIVSTTVSDRINILLLEINVSTMLSTEQCCDLLISLTLGLWIGTCRLVRAVRG